MQAWEGGGLYAKFGRPHRGGVSPDSTNMDRGREGVKNANIFADVLDGSPLRQAFLATLLIPWIVCFTLHWPCGQFGKLGQVALDQSA